MEEKGYQVLKVLGQGGQGRVYEVLDPQGRNCVLKQLPWVGDGDKEKALQEVKVLSSLRHPCIVPYLDSFLARSMPSIPTEDVLCLVMTRCERDLRQECLQRKEGGDQFPEAQVLLWLTQLCWGLQHLHARRFLHRDLKPQNVLMTVSGRVLLADFGVVGYLEHTSDFKKSIVGTPSFMSPEMLLGRPYGCKTDQWALGCVLYEIMALAPPFQGCDSYAAIVQAVLHSPNLKAPDGYSADLDQVLEALLERQPEERPSSAQLLSGALLSEPFHELLQSVTDEVREAACSPVENDAAYDSDFESYSGSEEGASPCKSPEPQQKEAPAVWESEGPPPGAICAEHWNYFLTEAETLLKPQVPLPPQEEMERVRASLCSNLGTPAQVESALSFLRERKPLGTTYDEAEEIVLQIEIVDLLGDNGLHALPLLERLLSLERRAAGGAVTHQRTV